MNEIYEKVHVPDIVGNQGYPPLKEEEKLEKLHRIREIQNIQKKIWDNQVSFLYYIFSYLKKKNWPEKINRKLSNFPRKQISKSNLKY